jgi:hypothetical protein
MGGILYRSNVSEHMCTVKKNLLTAVMCRSHLQCLQKSLQQVFPMDYFIAVYLE